MVQQDVQIAAAQRGDLGAFNALVLAYQDQVYSLTMRILQDPAGADDITQETFISAYRKLDQFQGGNFRAWLLRIATNACYDELRRHKRRPTESLDDDPEDGPGPEADARLASPAEGPEGHAQRGELRSAIERCLAALSPDQRLVIMMADVQDYAYDEIAQAADISLGTVKSRISRARANLRACLQTAGELLPAKYCSNRT
ncbi:MAG: RNA polymerase sigma factor [Anaerolineales bacterium]